MPWPNSAMDVFKLLDKSNCGDCNRPTCLAFAAAVFMGQKELAECTHLAPEIVAQYGGQDTPRPAVEPDQEDALQQLKNQISSLDLASAAHRLGARFANGKLTVKILGKDFSVDAKGNLFSDIHIHNWVAAPFLNYVIAGKGTPIAGKWMPLRELPNGKTWYRLFGQRCEKPLKQVADTYPTLFEDMIHLFNGRQIQSNFGADIELVLHPLPRVPMLICYWQPEDGLESNLNLFFDASAEDHLSIESIYSLGAGLVVMFEKIALRHGLS
jgi:hypothetical protein